MRVSRARASAALLIGALALRVGLAVLSPSIQRPDEIFQNLEPAHRLLTGFGIVTWEWRDGIRSWLFPGVLAGVMWLAHSRILGLLILAAGLAIALAGRRLSRWGVEIGLAMMIAGLAVAGASLMPQGGLFLVAAAMSSVSLLVVGAGLLLGWRLGGVVGAVSCGVLCACWPDLVYFSAKPLPEVQAGNFLVAAAAFATLAPPSPTRRGWAWRAGIGALLAASVCLRIQLAPAAAVVAVWSCRRELRGFWLPLLLGAAPLVALYGATDWITWGSPFQSVWKNVAVNVFEQKAASYGVTPWYFYLPLLLEPWGAAVAPVALCFLLGVRRAPLLAITAGVVGVTHSLIGHKEISFIFAAIPCGLIVAGLGAATLADLVATRMRAAPSASRLAVLAAAAWIGVSGIAAVGTRSMWHTGAAMLPVWQEAGRQQDLCGLGLYGPELRWWFSGGYTYLDRTVPIIPAPTPAALQAAAPAVNYLVATQRDAASVQGYDAADCRDGYCLLHRPGPCAQAAVPDLNAELRQSGT